MEILVVDSVLWISLRLEFSLMCYHGFYVFVTYLVSIEVLFTSLNNPSSTHYRLSVLVLFP